jgi:hypothetical protein
MTFSGKKKTISEFQIGAVMNPSSFWELAPHFINPMSGFPTRQYFSNDE